jgi:hypothetical protein
MSIDQHGQIEISLALLAPVRQLNSPRPFIARADGSCHLRFTRFNASLFAGLVGQRVVTPDQQIDNPAWGGVMADKRIFELEA